MCFVALHLLPDYVWKCMTATRKSHNLKVTSAHNKFNEAEKLETVLGVGGRGVVAEL